MWSTMVPIAGKFPYAVNTNMHLCIWYIYRLAAICDASFGWRLPTPSLGVMGGRVGSEIVS